MKKAFLRFLSLIIIAVSALSFFACGETDTFTLSFDADGGELSFKSEKIKTGEKIVFPEIVNQKADCKFVCFIYEFANSQYVFTEGDCFNLRADVTFTAVWSPVDANVIRYNLDGGHFEQKSAFYYDGSSDVSLLTPVKLGYRFMGYKENGEGEPVKNAVITAGESGDKSFTAVFEKAEYTVELRLTCTANHPFKEDVTETVNCLYHGDFEKTLKVAYGYSLALDKAVPIKNEYEFICWLYEKNGEKVKFAAQGEKGALAFNENNFEYGKTVILYVCCVPVTSEFI